MKQVCGDPKCPTITDIDSYNNWVSTDTTFDNVITASGVPIGGIGSIEIDDSWFMAECLARTKQYKDDKKCELCELRFRCYTECPRS